MDNKKTIDRNQLVIIKAATEAGFNKCAELLGLLKPYISLNEAKRKYGRRTVERWVREELITVIKDGNGQSKCRIKRDEIELVASLCNRASWFEHNE